MFEAELSDGHRASRMISGGGDERPVKFFLVVSIEDELGNCDVAHGLI